METTDLNPDGKDALIDSFCDITSSSKQEALFFLESSNFDLDAAVSTFLDNNTTTHPTVVVDDIINNTTTALNASPRSPDFIPSPSPSPSRSRSPSPTPSRPPYRLRSRRSLGKDSNTPSGSRPSRIRTLSDLRRSSHNEDDDSDSDSDEPQEYYTGGEKRYIVIHTISCTFLISVAFSGPNVDYFNM